MFGNLHTLTSCLVHASHTIIWYHRYWDLVKLDLCYYPIRLSHKSQVGQVHPEPPLDLKVERGSHAKNLIFLGEEEALLL
jgi:hypothetical protein